MTTFKKDEDMRYTPQTAQAHGLLELVRAYEERYALAKAASDALAEWTLKFVNLEPGTIIEANRGIKGSVGLFVPSFTMREPFTGWKGNKQRMLVQQVHAVSNGPLVHFPTIAVRLSGIPLKDDNQPFKGASCSVTLDITNHASSFSFKEESGYSGCSRDELARFLDHVSSEKTPA